MYYLKIYLQILMNARPTLMTVIHQRLAPIQTALSPVHATMDTRATVDPVLVSYKHINHVQSCHVSHLSFEDVYLKKMVFYQGRLRIQDAMFYLSSTHCMFGKHDPKQNKKTKNKNQTTLFTYAPIYVWIYENRAYNNNNSLGLFQDNTQAFHSMTHRQCAST